MTDTTYNGWRNVETWRVQLHLANDEQESRHVAAMARLYYLEKQNLFEGQPEGMLTVFSNALRGYVGVATEGEAVGGNTWEMFSRDVVQAALARVDWEQIAAHWLDVARHEVEREAAT
jgi:hypothetical protein